MPSNISTAVGRFHFAGCIARDPGKCSVEFGAIWTRFNILTINFEQKTSAVDYRQLTSHRAAPTRFSNGHTLQPATPSTGTWASPNNIRACFQDQSKTAFRGYLDIAIIRSSIRYLLSQRQKHFCIALVQLMFSCCFPYHGHLIYSRHPVPMQAKKLVESLPQEIRVNVSKEEAEKLKAALEAAGGTVVLE